MLEYWNPELPKVILFDSLGPPPTKDVKAQLHLCFHDGGKAVSVQMVRQQKQEWGLNNCAFFTAAFMVDIISSSNVAEAIYVDGQKQRDWFRDCLLKATIVSCQRQTKRPSRFKLTDPAFSEFTCTA